MSFKKGDKVFFIQDTLSSMPNQAIGKWFEVTGTNNGYDERFRAKAIEHCEWLGDSAWNIHPDDCLDEAIYNSPLYQALL